MVTDAAVDGTPIARDPMTSRRDVPCNLIRWRL